MTSPDEDVGLRHVRDNLIDYFETTASFDRQREYQDAVPFVSVPAELVCTFGDCVPDASCLQRWGPPTFTHAEVAALRAYDRVLDAVCRRLPDDLPELEQLQRLDEWERLRAAASDALHVFSRRGRRGGHGDED